MAAPDDLLLHPSCTDGAHHGGRRGGDHQRLRAGDPAADDADDRASALPAQPASAEAGRVLRVPLLDGGQRAARGHIRVSRAPVNNNDIVRPLLKQGARTV